MEKWGTRAHQARVPQKVVDPQLFLKQCSVAKNFKKTWYLAILTYGVVQLSHKFATLKFRIIYMNFVN